MNEDRQIIVSPMPFHSPSVMLAPQGATIRQIIDHMYESKGIVIRDYALMVEIDGEPIPKEEWFMVPPPHAHVLLSVPVYGGGDGSNPLRTILMIVLVVVAAVATWYVGGAGGFAVAGVESLGYGALAGYAAGAVVMTAGMLLVNAIAPVRATELSLAGSNSYADSPTYSLNGGQNSVSAFGTVPVILGTHKYVPLLGAMPYTEILGNDEYLRMLFIWGYGPLKIEDIKIGDTLLTAYSDYEIETVEGWDDDPEITLIPDVVVQVSGRGLLTYATGRLTQVAEPNVDELSVDILFPSGLVRIDDNGNRQNQSVDIKIEYREVGMLTWLIPPVSSWRSVDAKVFGNDGTLYAGTYEVYCSFAGVLSLNSASGVHIATVIFGETEVISVINYPNPALYTGMTVSAYHSVYYIEQNLVIQNSISIDLGRIYAEGLAAITDAQPVALKFGYRWAVDRTKSYEVALTRLTVDNTNDRIVDEVDWMYLRTTTHKHPVNFPHPLAMTAIRIKATDQLQGVISNLSATVSIYAEIWDGDEWGDTKVITQNPAALFRSVLMSPANIRFRSTTQINDPILGEWYEFCETNGYKFNMVRDYQSSVWTALADIAAAGRASPSLADGLWGVIWDSGDQPVVQHITPRNSWGFSSEKVLFEQPHGFRVRFLNEDTDYQNDERVVYDDGYTVDNATYFESLEFPGVTDPDLIWKFGRFHIAQARLRPEAYTLFMDFEHLVCSRGSKVRISHDVPMWGSSWGRVKELITSGANTTGVILDEKVIMAAAPAIYGCRFRLADAANSSLALSVETIEGESNMLVFSSPIPTVDGPQVGDMAMFGEAERETVECLVKSIARSSDFTAQLTLVDCAPAIYTADSGSIPAFDSLITHPLDITKFIPTTPIIINVQSGNFTLEIFDGVVRPRMFVNLEMQGGLVKIKSFKIRYRPQGSSESAWMYATASPADLTAILTDVIEGAVYEIQAQAISIYNDVESLWSAVTTHTVIGQTGLPETPLEFTASLVGQSIVLAWAPPTDVTITGHSIYLNGTVIVENYAGSAYVYNGVLAAGTYNFTLRAVNRGGESADTATASITIALPATPAPAAVINGEQAVVTWSDCKTSLAIDYYKVNTVPQGKSLRYIDRINWIGEKVYSIIAVDFAGNESSAGTVSLTIIGLTTPTGITATGFTYMICLGLTYASFVGFAVVEIWSSTINNRAGAVKVGETAAKVWTHNGLALIDTRYYWIRTRNIYGTVGDWYPASATAGVSGSTSQDPADYLDILTGNISENELVTELNSRINLIDTSDFIFEPGIYEPGIYGGMNDAYTGLARIAASHKGSLDTLAATAIAQASDLSSLSSEVASLTTTEWSAIGDYILGKYTVYSGEVYRCIQPYTYAIEGTKTPGVDTAYWEQSDALATIVSDIDTRVDVLEGEITTKVSSTTFDLLENRVDVTESDIIQNSGDILLRVAQTEFDEFSAAFLPAFDPGNFYQVNDYVRFEGGSYRCKVLIDFSPAPVPTDTDYWEESDFADKFTTIINELEVNTEGITLISSQLVGPIAYEPGIYEDGVYVETLADLETIADRMSLARIDLNGAKADIVLQAVEMDYLAGRISQAEIDIDGANASIALKASQGSLDATNAELALAEIVIDGNTAAIALKAAQSVVTALTSRVSQAELDIDGAEAAIALKVAITTYNADQKVAGVLRIAAAESNIGALQTADGTLQSNINAKVAISTYNADQKVGGVLRIAAAEQSIGVIGGDVEDMKAQYTLKLNVNNRVAGFGLMLSEDAPSEFAIMADVFSIVNPDVNADVKVPFTLQEYPAGSGTWVLGLDADLIVKGSILADKLSVVSLSAISANLGGVTAGSIVIGTTNKLWLNDSADGALNIGGATKASAAFKVSAAGLLTAAGAVITGDYKTSPTVGATKGVWLDPSTNQMYFYGDYGDGTGEIGELASIGINNIGGDWIVGNFGDFSSPYVAVFGRSYNKSAMVGWSNTGRGVEGVSNSGYAIFGTGNSYFTADVSALSFTDRTPHYEGDALAEIKIIKGKNGQIDHLTLPTFARRKTTVQKKITDKKGKVVLDGNGREKFTDEPADGRDIGAMVSILTVGMQQLLTRVEALEN